MHHDDELSCLCHKAWHAVAGETDAPSPTLWQLAPVGSGCSCACRESGCGVRDVGDEEQRVLELPVGGPDLLLLAGGGQVAAAGQGWGQTGEERVSLSWASDQGGKSKRDLRAAWPAPGNAPSGPAPTTRALTWP